MKKILLSACMLFGIAAGAQTINFPDANFKNKLVLSSPNLSEESGLIAKGINGQYIAIDSNIDGEIDQNEALLVYGLTVFSADITSFDGIEHFTNLKSFFCEGNSYVSLDLSGLTNLKYLDLYDNELLSTINLSGLSNLENLNLDNCQLTSLDLSDLTSLEDFTYEWGQLTNLTVAGLSNLKYLNGTGNKLQTLDLTGLSGLKVLGLNSNLLTSIDFSPLQSIESIEILNNNLTSIDISMLPTLRSFMANNNDITNANVAGLNDLEYLSLQFNQLSSIDLTGLTSVTNLSINSNLLTSIDVTPVSDLLYLEMGYNLLTSFNINGLESLGRLNLEGNQLTNVDIHDFPNLGTIDIGYNPLTELQLNGVSQLTSINCNNTMLTELDLSNCPAVVNVGCNDNSVLERINVKNGGLLLNLIECDFSGNPMLTFMCIDEEEDAMLLPYFTNQNITPPAMSTNCSFVMANDKFTFENISVYPNPSKDIVKIDADSEIKSIYLYDIHGRQLQVNNSNQTDVVFDVSGRASGIYFIKIVTEKGIKVEKLIRE